jgi:diguanylate cyclase (GGDEF)-like protein/PAS domain S-box-containing protein
MWKLGSGSRGKVLLVAAAAFAAIFAARLATDSVGTGVGFLYVVPIVVLAVEFGRRAGLLAGGLALVLFAVWDELGDQAIDAVGYVSRAVIFLLVGWVTGRMSERLHRALARAEGGARHFALTRDLLCTASFEGYLTHVNGSWQRTLGWTPEELMGRPFIEFVHPDDRDATEAEVASAAMGNHTLSFTNRYRTKNGDWRWIEWSSHVDPERELIYGAGRDVTDRRQSEYARREAEERFRRAFEDSAVGMAVVGIRGEDVNRILQANQSLADIIGVDRERLLGTTSLGEFADPGDVEAITRGLVALMSGEVPVFRTEFRILRPDGEPVWVDLTTSVIRDADGRMLYRVSQVVDIDARKTAAEKLRYLADHDALSGVFNRRRFEQELERELGHAAARGGRGAVLLLDVDNFKAINDTHGHATGDAVISRLGETLSSRLRTSDVVSRLGGDEFAVLLRRGDADDALEVASGLRELAMERLGDIAGGELRSVTLSVGVAAFGYDGEEVPGPDELLSRADRAMYAAKRAGGNRVLT